MSTRTGSTCILRGAAAGALGGFVASWVMNGFIATAMTAQEALKSPEQKAQEQSQKPQGEEQSEDSTVKVADALTWIVTGRHLGREGKQRGGPIVHYAFGTLMGALYGTFAELSDTATAGTGSAFGTALFIGADEVMVPALGLGKFPTEESVGSQITHLAAHIVYGTTTELVRRLVA